jgi:hypothetical protein
MSTTHVGAQSLRVGGATTLSAALYPDSLIQSIGHWRSLCFKQYTKLTVLICLQAMKALSNPSLCIKLLHANTLVSIPSSKKTKTSNTTNAVSL